MAWSGDGRVRCVMNQLLEMERSLNNFMLETVLKLQTLTQTKVFLLLESKHYRRYGGSPELVAGFEESNFLLNERNDQISVEVQLETTEVLHETRRGKRKPNKEGDDSVANGGSSPSKKSRSNGDQRNESRSRNGDRHEASASKEVVEYQRPAEDFIKRENDVQFTDDQMFQVYDHLRLTDPLLSLQNAGQRLSTSTGLLAEEEEEEYSDGYAEEDPEDANQRVLDSATDPAFRPGMYSLENVRKSRKYREIETVEDVTLAYVKGTREFRLLGSTLYDIGKEIGLRCPIRDVESNRPEAKQYLNDQMELYLPLFDKFKNVEKRPFRDVLKTQLPESYMKNRMRCGFVKSRPNYYRTKPKSPNKQPKKSANKAFAPPPDAFPYLDDQL